MKVLLSWLREFVDVPGTADEIGGTMSVRGFAVESIESYGEDDAVIDFEITANRPDCMSVAGMAREVAASDATPVEPGEIARYMRMLREAGALDDLRTYDGLVSSELIAVERADARSARA